MSKIYIVGTPIGNLEDITLRALRVLSEVDLVLCEDTRKARKILDKYDIKTSLQSYHSKSALGKINKISEYIKEGKNIALITDSGTPGISDPGPELLEKLKEKNLDFEVSPVPGPSALTAALSISAIPASSFLFLGFLPKKKRREKIFEEIKNSKRPVVFYESPHRIIKTLEYLRENLNGRKIFLAREITKIYEEFIYDTSEEILAELLKDPKKQKGEFVLIVEDRNKR